MISVARILGAPVHEPGAEPDPMRYVPWDYAVGYLDGMDSRY